jgi:hypothetical protein
MDRNYGYTNNVCVSAILGNVIVHMTQVRRLELHSRDSLHKAFVAAANVVPKHNDKLI